MPYSLKDQSVDEFLATKAASQFCLSREMDGHFIISGGDFTLGEAVPCDTGSYCSCLSHLSPVLSQARAGLSLPKIEKEPRILLSGAGTARNNEVAMVRLRCVESV